MGMCPNSPAMLCWPRRSSPPTTTPTPSPSETLTKTRLGGCRPGCACSTPGRGRRPCPSSRGGRGGPGPSPAARAAARRATEVGGEEHAAGAVLDHARHHHADALAPAEVAVLGEDRLDPLHEVGGEALRVGQGREARHAHELVADEVGHHRVGAQHADVHGDHAALARVDVEELRPPAAQGLAGRALEDEALPDQLVHEQADRAPTGAHEPGEVGPGDRLVRPHQAERDPAVDLAGRPARGDLEVPGVDAAHGDVSGAGFVSDRGNVRGPAQCQAA